MADRREGGGHPVRDAGGLARVAAAAEAGVAGLSWAMTALAAIAVALIVAILLFSAVQRYILASPFPQTEELAAFLFVVVAFFSIPLGFLKGRQIRIVVLWRKLPQGAQGWAMLLGHLLTIFVLVMVIRETGAFSHLSYEFASRSWNADFLEWPWQAVIPGSLAVLVLAVAARFLVDLARILAGRPVVVAEDAARAQRKPE